MDLRRGQLVDDQLTTRLALDDGSGYTAASTGTVTFDPGSGDLVVDGTWSDSLGRHGEAFHGKRVGGPNTIREGDGQPIKRKTGLYTLCNRGPNPTDVGYEGDATYAHVGEGLEFELGKKSQQNEILGLPLVPLVCFSDVRAACNGLDVLGLTPIIDGGSFGYTTTSYYDTSVAPNSAAPAGSTVARSASFVQEAASAPSHPKLTTGDADVKSASWRSLGDDPELANVLEVGSFLRSLQKGIVLGGFRTRVPLGSTTSTTAKLSGKGKKFVAAMRAAGLTEFPAGVLVSLKRKDFDRKPLAIGTQVTIQLH